MYYKRAVSIPYKRLLSRNELKVFTSCRVISKLEDIINKTRLPKAEVVEIINTFIAENLMYKFDSYKSAEAYKESQRPRLKIKVTTAPKANSFQFSVAESRNHKTY